MPTGNGFIDGKPYKLIAVASGEVTPPEGKFRFVAPVGVSATWKGATSADITALGGADHAVGGAYTGAGLEEYSSDIGSYTKITVSAGTVKAYYW